MRRRLFTRILAGEIRCPFVAIGTIVVAFIAAWLINWNALQENMTLLSALESPNLSMFEKAISYGHIWHARGT